MADNDMMTDKELKGKRRILFVCLGNICRSPAAEGIMKRIVEEAGAAGYVIDSAGTGRYHIGQLTPSDFDDFDLIIGMDNNNIANLHAIAPSPEAEDKIVAMGDLFNKSTYFDHVPDPYYEGDDGFEIVLDLLEEGCHNLYNAVEGK